MSASLPRSLILALSLAATASGTYAAETVDMYKNPYCGCCKKWAEHMQQNGFTVNAHEVNDVSAERKKLGMPEQLASCHTARVGNYIIEGHVPATDIQRLLKEKPKALGLAVPGMPQGSPGMESPHPESYKTLLVQPDGSVSVFEQH